MTLSMADSITPADLPGGYGAYAGYVDGRWPDYQAIAAQHKVPVLGIAVTAADDAEALDVEPYDATAGQAAGWVLRQHARGVSRPVLYASISNMLAVLADLAGAGITRSQVRLWSAHYGAGEHICGPSTCRYAGGMTPACDGTQFTDAAPGLNGSRIDASVLANGFFRDSPPPSSNWTEDMMRELPTLREGAQGVDVRTIQGCCGARGHVTAVDGVWGPLTTTAVKECQADAHITVDGVCGPQTWQALVLG